MLDPNATATPDPTPAPAVAEPTPAPAPAPVDDTGEPTPAPAEDPAADPPAQPRDDKGRFQARVDSLTREKGEAEREAAYWRGLALARNGAPAPATPAPAAQPAADTEPDPEQFANYAEYVKELTAWTARQTVAQERQREATARASETRATNWQSRQTAFAESTPDYREVVGTSQAPVTGAMAEALQESEHGPALAYHLAKHPDEAAELAALPERAMLRRLGMLEARIAATPAPAPAPAARTTNAPPPVKPVNNAGPSAPPSLDKMSMDEYVAQRRKQGAGWAR
jgi:hypothetical protein